MDPSGWSHRQVRYVHYTALEVLEAATTPYGAHGAYRASDTAACRAQTGSFPCTRGWSPTRTAENRAQLMSDAAHITCG